MKPEYGPHLPLSICSLCEVVRDAVLTMCELFQCLSGE
jgi:hypothetical protein